MDLSGVEEAIENCLTFHSNAVSNSIEDERDFLRTWRRRWRDAVAGENLRLLRFLRSANELSDPEFVTQIRNIPPSSDWFTRHIRGDIFDLSGVLADLDARLGVDYVTLRRANHQAQQCYVDVLARLFDCETALNVRLADIRTLETRLSGLTIIDISGAEVAELQTSILNYIRGVYRSRAIEEAYTSFIKCYAEWHALRGLVLGRHVARSEASGSGPICSICTTEKITAALTPCGHTFCNNCAQRQRRICYICRSAVRERLRIYFT